MRKPFGWSLGQWSGVAAALTLLAALPVAIHGAKFYFIDDFQDYFMPMFLEIGRQVVHGTFPFVTLKSWFSGGITAEYAFSVFNPIILALCAGFYLFFQNFSYAAAVFSIFHLVLFGLGVFAICGTLRCRVAESVFAAVVAGTGIWLIYWAAMSWASTLVSIAWFAWTVAAFIRLEREPRWLLPAGLLTALTLASGTPHTDVALAVFIGVFLLHIFATDGWRACSTVLLAAVGGVMLATPSLLPLVAYHAISIRASSFSPLQWTVPIYAFASIGLPAFFSPWLSWDHWEIYGLPIVYLDWAVPIILVKCWRHERFVFNDECVKLLGLLTLVFFGLCMVPNVTTVRWSFRFLPFLHLFLMLMVARIFTVRRLAGISRLAWDWQTIALAVVPPVVVAGAFATLFSPPLQSLVAATVEAIGVLLALSLALPIIAWRLRATRAVEMLTVVHAAVFVFIVLAWPTNPSLARWDTAAYRNLAVLDMVPEGNGLWLWTEDPSLNIEPPDGRAVQSLSGPAIHPFSWRYRGFAPLYYGKSFLNGYTGLGSAPVERFLHFGQAGDVSLNPLPRVFSIDPATGASFAELMRIQSIVADNGRWTAAAARTLPASWTRASLPQGIGVVFRRPPAEHPLPGTLSFLPQGVAATLQSFSEWKERYRIVVSPYYDGRPIVFARAWYPGYRIYLNGQSVAYERIGGLLPALVLPTGFAGTLEIVYLPAGFLPGCLLAGIAATGLMLTTIRRRRRVALQPGLV